MKTQKIISEAKANKGLKFTAAEFKYSFGRGMVCLNSLVNAKVFTVSGKTKSGDLVYEVA